MCMFVSPCPFYVDHGFIVALFGLKLFNESSCWVFAVIDHKIV